MYLKKQQLLAKLTQISQQRHSHDQKFSTLQSLLTHNKKYQVTQLRQKFTTVLEELQAVVKENLDVLELLAYRCEKLGKEDGRQGMGREGMRLGALREYFLELKEKIRREGERGQQIITARQRWQLTTYPQSPQPDEQQSLLTSHSTAKQTTELARSVLSSISDQSNRIQKIRDQMGTVLKNINFSGNLAQLVRTRSREDNRLIVMLSVGLVVWIVFCVGVVKPMYRGW